MLIAHRVENFLLSHWIAKTVREVKVSCFEIPVLFSYSNSSPLVSPGHLLVIYLIHIILLYRVVLIRMVVLIK
jgi:hypothetical protein